MVVPMLLPIIGCSVFCVLVSYVLIRLYRSREAYSNVLPNPVSSFKLARPIWWDWHRSLTWTWPTSRKKASPASSNTGVLPLHHCPLFDDVGVPLVDLAPGRKVLPLVYLSDVEDYLGVEPPSPNSLSPMGGLLSWLPFGLCPHLKQLRSNLAPHSF